MSNPKNYKLSHANQPKIIIVMNSEQTQFHNTTIDWKRRRFTASFFIQLPISMAVMLIFHINVCQSAANTSVCLCMSQALNKYLIKARIEQKSFDKKRFSFYLMHHTHSKTFRFKKEKKYHKLINIDIVTRSSFSLI